MDKDISAFIISGGKSSRMGSDKASLVLKGTSFLERILVPLNALNIPTKIVSNHSEHKKFGVPIIEDIVPNVGPVGGITTALNDSKTELNLILSCDIPLINEEFLIWFLKMHQNEYDATIVKVKDQIMPLIGIYKKSCKNIFLEKLKQQKLKLLSVIDELKVNYVKCPIHLEKFLQNINTKEEFNRIEHEM